MNATIVTLEPNPFITTTASEPRNNNVPLDADDQDFALSAFPYPGLRSFEQNESDIFFGREKQTSQLLAKVKNAHFLAVVGSSGCGKSSLVRAGMIASLEAGFIVTAGSRWHSVEMRPGDKPLRRLAEALLLHPALAAQRKDESEAVAFLQATLRRGPLGLIQALQETPIPPGSNLLLLVDQFEEIFRYRRERNADEADAFVALLLKTAEEAQDKNLPIYVVLTMRSDFLGECAVFSGLPEALNDSQFLTPRLNRDQMEDAIVGPARVFGGDVEPALVNRLLNDVTTDPDQLPLLQHTLMRLWNYCCKTPGRTYLTERDYNSIGTIEDALSRHADETFDLLKPDPQRTGDSPDRQQVAQVLFRRLCEQDTARRRTRHPVSIGEIAEVAGVSTGVIIAIIEVFREPERSFLMPPPSSVPHLDEDTPIDISHETLLRQWKRLKQWIQDESNSAKDYQILRDAALRRQAQGGDLFRSSDTSRTRLWFEREHPTAAWARRYVSRELQDQRAIQAPEEWCRLADAEFNLAIQFYKDSQAQLDKERAEKEAAEKQRVLDAENDVLREKAQRLTAEKWEKRYKRISLALSIMSVLGILLTIAVLYESHQEKYSEKRARSYELAAEKSAALAEQSAAEAADLKQKVDSYAQSAIVLRDQLHKYRQSLQELQDQLEKQKKVETPSKSGPETIPPDNPPSVPGNGDGGGGGGNDPPQPPVESKPTGAAAGATENDDPVEVAADKAQQNDQKVQKTIAKLDRLKSDVDLKTKSVDQSIPRAKTTIQQLRVQKSELKAD